MGSSIFFYLCRDPLCDKDAAPGVRNLVLVLELNYSTSILKV